MSQKHAVTSERAARIEPLTLLATGGMAEIWLSREVGAAGLERFVVVKRLLPHLARDPELVDMFVSEARFVARLVHPNVVQIHDLGEDDEGYFLVMEYVAGCSVSEMLTAAADARAKLPLAASLCIAEQACLGAHAAHELCDPTGSPLGLVHRDISPHNLMVGPSGEVKLLDFGIAKATAAADATRTGSLKGKHGYMSPEQCASARLDRRSDVFALGIVCWELFTGARLFKRETEYATMHAIVSGDVRPPSALREGLPAAFDEAVGKALALDPERRWQTADAFRRALVAAAEESGIRPSRDALVGTLAELLGSRLEERERALRDAARSGRFPEPQALRAALVQPERSAPRPSTGVSDAAATVFQRRPSAPPGEARDSVATVFQRRPSAPPGEDGVKGEATASAAPADAAAEEAGAKESAPRPSDRDTTLRSARPVEIAAGRAEEAPSQAERDRAEEAPSQADAERAEETAPQAERAATPEPRAPGASRRFLIGGVLAVAAAAAAVVAMRPSEKTPPSPPPAATETASASAPAPLAGPPLRFGVPPTVAQDVLRSELAPFLGWLGRALGRPVELAIADSYDDTGDMVAAGRADFALLPPLLFVRTEAREPGLQPLAVRLFDGSRASDGYLLVRDDAPLSQPSDLRGRRICYVDRASSTGFLLPRIWMRKAGLVPDRDVEAVLSGDHLAAMRDLTAGKCDAAAVYSGAYVSARQEGIAVGLLRVMAVTGRVPQDAVVAAPGLPAAEVQRLRAALLGFEPRRDIDAGRIGEVLGITGFAELQTAEFDGIREAARSEGLVPAGDAGARE